jgi:flagellar basal body-associated protein FliL
MSDNVDDQDMSFAEGGESESSAPAPKAKGAGPGILKILMFVGIGLGAIILIVVVSLVTVNLVNKQQKPMAAIPVTEEYQAATPVYSFTSNVPEIRTKTRDKEALYVQVKINVGFEEKDKTGPGEFANRSAQIRDYLRNYFSMKYGDELAPEREKELKEELRENLNRMLSKPFIKEVLFEELNVYSM